MILNYVSIFCCMATHKFIDPKRTLLSDFLTGGGAAGHYYYIDGLRRDTHSHMTFSNSLYGIYDIEEKTFGEDQPYLAAKVVVVKPNSIGTWFSDAREHEFSLALCLKDHRVTPETEESLFQYLSRSSFASRFA